MSLSFEKIKLLSAELNGESSLPPLAYMDNVQNLTESALDEDDGLFVGYGFLPSVFPYRMQDLYNRSLKEKEYQCAVLENEYLRAVFLPDFGGRMWSLYDKKAQRDLVYQNPVIRPCNLAVRNAWISGGIEYNCGMVGHGPFTCSRIFTARAALEDGTPVLRMYEFERVRRIVYQMDFFLPEDYKVLYARIRIVNPNREVVPMYWWTNIAVPEGKEYRNVVNSSEAYNNFGGCVCKNPVPHFNGNDITYPVNNPIAVDYFWKIPESQRKYTAYLDKNGYGLVQTSTSRLKGRKLFVWGQGPGGARWQEFLTQDNSDQKYVEIQAGLANTQYECLPMPPKTAWEWMECYGALQTRPQKVHGNWDEAISETAECLERLVPEDALESLLKSTRKAAVSPAEALIFRGSGWGELERLRRAANNEDELCPHLDFGGVGPEQQEWLTLLNTGNFSEFDAEKMPLSWMLQPEWTEIIKKSGDGHKKYLHLAAVNFVNGCYDEAEGFCRKALEYLSSPAALFIMSQIMRIKDQKKQAAQYALEAYEFIPEDISLARQAMESLSKAAEYKKMLAVYETFDEKLRNDGRIMMLYCLALLRTGDISGAEEYLYHGGGICVVDIREGEISITDLYLEIEEAKARRDGLPFSREDAVVPRKFDFRMSVEKKNQ